MFGKIVKISVLLVCFCVTAVGIVFASEDDEALSMEELIAQYQGVEVDELQEAEGYGYNPDETSEFSLEKLFDASTVKSIEEQMNEGMKGFGTVKVQANKKYIQYTYTVNITVGEDALDLYKEQFAAQYESQKEGMLEELERIRKMAKMEGMQNTDELYVVVKYQDMEGKELFAVTLPEGFDVSTDGLGFTSENWKDLEVSIDGNVVKLPIEYSEFERITGYHFKTDDDRNTTLKGGYYTYYWLYNDDGGQICIDITNGSDSLKRQEECMVTTVDSYCNNDIADYAELELCNGINSKTSVKDLKKIMGVEPDYEYTNDVENELSETGFDHYETYEYFVDGAYNGRVGFNFTNGVMKELYIKY